MNLPAFRNRTSLIFPAYLILIRRSLSANPVRAGFKLQTRLFKDGRAPFTTLLFRFWRVLKDFSGLSNSFRGRWMSFKGHQNSFNPQFIFFNPHQRSFNPQRKSFSGGMKSFNGQWKSFSGHFNCFNVRWRCHNGSRKSFSEEQRSFSGHFRSFKDQRMPFNRLLFWLIHIQTSCEKGLVLVYAHPLGLTARENKDLKWEM